MKGEKIYEGKAKILYADTENSQQVYMSFKDSLTAFNALKKGSFAEKGIINLKISEHIFNFLKELKIPTHWLRRMDDNTILAEKLTIIPLEVVVRNRLAGSTAKKLGITEGQLLKKPLVEFYFKNDELQDPFLSDDQIFMLEIINSPDLEKIKDLALKINTALKEIFSSIDLDLVDFKIEFGKDVQGQIKLADEISPDSMRLWDFQTGEKMDKDRFRRDLGKVEESYREVLNRLEKRIQERGTHL